MIPDDLGFTHIVIFADPDRTPAYFTSPEDAFEFYEEARLNWTCRLFCIHDDEGGPAPIAHALRYATPDKESGLQSWIGVWNAPEVAQQVQAKVAERTEIVPVAAPAIEMAAGYAIRPAASAPSRRGPSR